MGEPGWHIREGAAVRQAYAESHQRRLEDKIKELEIENSRLKESSPNCRCLNCGIEFTIRPHLDQESVEGYAARLSKVNCFKCGAKAGQLTVIA